MAVVAATKLDRAKEVAALAWAEAGRADLAGDDFGTMLATDYAEAAEAEAKAAEQQCAQLLEAAGEMALACSAREHRATWKRHTREFSAMPPWPSGLQGWRGHMNTWVEAYHKRKRTTHPVIEHCSEPATKRQRLVAGTAPAGDQPDLAEGTSRHRIEAKSSSTGCQPKSAIAASDCAKGALQPCMTPSLIL